MFSTEQSKDIPEKVKQHYSWKVYCSQIVPRKTRLIVFYLILTPVSIRAPVLQAKKTVSEMLTSLPKVTYLINGRF